MDPVNSRRVVITGMGAISPLGNTLPEFWDALIRGQSGVRKFESFPPTNLPTSVAAEARQFTGHISEFGSLPAALTKLVRKGLKVMCRESQMGVAAAQLALQDAQADESNIVPERCGCVFGSDYMMTLPQDFDDGIRKCTDDQGKFQYARWGTDGLAQMQPLWLLKYLPNMPASHIAIYNDLRGPSNSITLREAASNVAVGEAFHTIVRNSADLMVAGATGTRIHPMKAVHAAQTEQLADDPGDPARASRPFDKDRTGMVLGEGAGAIVLEDLAHAKARGARIYAEIVGAGSSSVAEKNLVAHRSAALASAMRAALRGAGASADDVGHINAHGLASPSCDAEEARAIAEVFGEMASKIPVTAAKSYFGNLGSGSGLVELIASVLSLKNGRLFRTLNYEHPDPVCPLAVAVEQCPPGDSFLKLSVTPQGQAAAVMIRAYG